jgi:hypothetical protein
VVEIRLDGARPTGEEARYLYLREVLVVTEYDDGALSERKPTHSAPGFVEVRVLDQTRDNRRLATLHSKVAKMAATQIDHRGSEVGGGIVQRPSCSGDPNKRLLYKFLGVWRGTDQQQSQPDHPVALGAIQSL